ncbi:thioesterase family protein [Shouchella shacheensis]|uniref:thioesterase family protein n=1 Tax=Shouchella shacheensis TaxID=1649580 RepID=UPI00073FBDDE|nr:thioesterase family protein [Shouchella shacheensis]
MAKLIWTGEVRAEWVDYNGHMNDACYALAFSEALEGLIQAIGLNEESRRDYQYTIFTLETHLQYVAEAKQGEKLTVEVSLADSDAKRMHLVFLMKNEAGALVAASEQMTMGMDQQLGRPAPFPEAVAATIRKLPVVSAAETENHVGRVIGIRRK